MDKNRYKYFNYQKKENKEHERECEKFLLNKKYEKRDGFTISYIDEMQMTLIDSENKKHVFMKL